MAKQVTTTITIQDATTEPYEFVRRMATHLRAATVVKDLERDLETQGLRHHRAHRAGDLFFVIEVHPGDCSRRVLVTIDEDATYSRNLLNMVLVGTLKSSLGLE